MSILLCLLNFILLINLRRRCIDPLHYEAPAILKKVSEDIASIVNTPDAKSRWETLGAAPMATTPEQCDATIRADTDRYGKLLKAAGVSVN